MDGVQFLLLLGKPLLRSQRLINQQFAVLYFGFEASAFERLEK